MQAAVTVVEPPTEQPRPDRRDRARRALDEVAEAENLDHRELADVLLEARDTLVSRGRVPAWRGEADLERHAAMHRD